MKIVIKILPICVILLLFNELEAEKSSSDCATKSCYRSYDGSCNNKDHPYWGKAGTEFTRFVKKYSYEGECGMANLTNTRKISLGIYPDIGVEDKKYTVFYAIWGQFVTHDMMLSEGTITDTGPTTSCQCVNRKLKDSTASGGRCSYIKMPEWDSYTIPNNIDCISFLRTGISSSSSNKPCEQINAKSHYLDLSHVYGNSEEEAKILRKGEHGLLNYIRIDGRPYPPDANVCNDDAQTGADKRLCIQTGDDRANQNPPLALMQIMFVRFHNKIAIKLHKMNKHWDDEKVYQETRKIVIAFYQEITKKYIKGLIGAEKIYDLNLWQKKHGYHNVYDPKVNPSVLNEFGAGAFRSQHSVVPGYFNLLNENRHPRGLLRLSDHMVNPSVLLVNNTELYLTIGVTNQMMYASDRYHHRELTLFLFRGSNDVGVDLLAIDTLRGRDHGLAFYIDVMDACGICRPKSWEDLEAYMPKEHVALLKRYYGKIERVELRTGGQLETNEKGALVGPTFNCIIKKQFYNSIVGDRYWYENEHQDCPFTTDQLETIRKSATSSLLICYTIEGIDHIQRDAFVKSGPDYNNNLVRCSDLENIDLSLWREDDPCD